MKRLRKELSKLKNPTKPADVAKAAAVEKFAEVIVGDDLTKWSVRLKGPDGVDPPMPFAPFVGATFTVEIQFPSEYPFKAPKVKFETPIFHPNVGEPDSDLAGEICAEVLEKGWSPTLDASHIVTTLHQMLLEPNPGGCTVAASARPLAHALRALRALLTILSSSLLFSPPHPLFSLSLACASPLRLAAESRGGEDVERMLLRRGGGSAWRDGAVHEQGARGGGDGVLVVALVRVHAAVALVLLRERERERTKEKARAPQMRSGTIRE